MAKKPYFGDKNRNILETHFFYKNRASSLFYIYWRLTSCKKSEKSNGGKYENFCYWLTDRQTDWRCWFHKDSRRVLISPIRPFKYECQCMWVCVCVYVWGSTSTSITLCHSNIHRIHPYNINVVKPIPAKVKAPKKGLNPQI